MLDGAARERRPPPPRAWYLPDVAAGHAELDSFDVIEDHYVGGIGFDVLTGISLHGGLVAAWPGPPLRAQSIVDLLVEHWRLVGRPAYAQFDKDSRFCGHQRLHRPSRHGRAAVPGAGRGARLRAAS